ncbi:MAG TPA: PEP-utilizing enzyme [Acidimicrobiales bacterium]|nr:PEP-utilizing enzyme [Acidimicrobiales bacterium]
MDTWITDTSPRTRFRYFTRANADEVGPEPFSPLGWSLGFLQGTGPGAADGFVTFGVVTAEELAPDHQIFGNWGSYFYNPMSLSRLLGVRMPGVDVDAIDKAYFGDHPGVPPYEPDPQDESPERSEHLAVTLGRVMDAESWPAMDEAVALSRKAVANRPRFGDLGDAELVAYARRMAQEIRRAWGPYCEVVLGASIGPGAVAAVCEALGRGSDTVKLFTGIGGVESAGGGLALWSLSRRVRGSVELTRQFDAGPAGLLDRIRASDSPDAREFLTDLDTTLRDYGHRGPHEWDMRSHSWDTRPELVLGMVDRIRLQGDDHDPAVVAAAAAAERRRLSAEISAMLAGDPESQAVFLAGLRSGTVFYQTREAGKSAVIRLHHEAKLALFELGRRMVERAVLDDPQQLFMLLEPELDRFVEDPAEWSATLRDRARSFDALKALEPPYIVDARVGPPPLSEWTRRGGSGGDVVREGDVLQGAPASPGLATGRARVILDPEVSELEPGDVLVCPTTDPSWTPLFLATAAVVCDVGAVGSHAAIVSRELGVPCAVSVHDATRRIPEGATVTVDGSTGQVTVVSVPAAP